MKLKIFFVLLCIMGLSACSNFEQTDIMFEDEVVVGIDVLEYSDTNIDFEEQQKILKRLEIEKRLELKKKRQSDFENIVFNYQYIVLEEYMPYGLFTPSTAKYFTEVPLIVWLHGSGERGVSEDIFNQRGIVDVLNNWELNGFSAYVLCPHLAVNGYSSSWNNDYSRENLLKLIDYFIKEYSIDEDKIYIVGHSLGAQGALYMTQKEDIFAAQGLLSGYPAYTDIRNTTIPTKCYVGAVAYGEDSKSVDFTLTDLMGYFGEENINIIFTSHRDVPKMAFMIDENEDNQSDFVNWLLKQRK